MKPNACWAIFDFYIGHNSFKDVLLYKNKLDLILIYVRLDFFRYTSSRSVLLSVVYVYECRTAESIDSDGILVFYIRHNSSL